MRIENITKIIDGKLQNFPSIDYINSFRINPDNIERGDLFLDVNNSIQNQETAIEKGAYAIVSENITNMIDSEIAWIEVDSLRLACIKLSRYEFSRKNCSLLFLDDISEEIFHSIIKHKAYEKLPSNVYKTLLMITKNGENVKYTCSDERLAHSIDPVCSTIKEISSIQSFKPKSPFYTSFVYGEIFYKDIRIPNIFIKYFCKVIEFVQEKKINCDFGYTSMSEHFSPVFTDSKLSKKEFGQSTKAVIFEKNIDYLDLEIKYLQNFTKDTIICIPRRYSNYFKNYDKSYLFANKSELEQILKENFRYALVFGNIKDYHDMFKHTKMKNGGLF